MLLLLKLQDFLHMFFQTAFYGLDTEPEPKPVLVKVGTGTVINSYVSTTLVLNSSVKYLSRRGIVYTV